MIAAACYAEVASYSETWVAFAADSSVPSVWAWMPLRSLDLDREQGHVVDQPSFQVGVEASYLDRLVLL